MDILIPAKFFPYLPVPFLFYNCEFRFADLRRKGKALPVQPTWASSLPNRPSQLPAAQLARKRQELPPLYGRASSDSTSATSVI